METNILQKELIFFENKHSELLEEAKGEFVLIKNEEIIDIFKSEDDAIRQGYKKFGNNPFLVKQITEFERIYNFTNLSIRI